MNCKISGEKLRVFSKGIRLFSKLSNEVLITADNNGMKLQAINENKTCFIEIQFVRNFFQIFECNEETKCKILLKSLILVFRVLNIDKIVETCTIIMNNSVPRVVFQMKCKNDVIREYFLPYMESTSFRYSLNRNRTNPTFKVQSKVMSECLQHFSTDTKDISVWLLSQQILFKSYFDDIEDQNIITSFAYKSREFRDYSFNNEISVTFNLKDLKSFIELAAFKDQSIECFFEASGKPIEFIVNTNDFYSAQITLSTHDFPEDESPVPPTINNQHSYQSSSLLGTGDLSVEDINPTSSMNSSAIPPNPECIPNTSVSNSVSITNNNNIIQANDGNEEDDPFTDNDIIEEMLSQLPVFSSDDSTNTNTNPVISLTGSPLYRYHMSVLHPNDEDDNPVLSSQDIIVPESDEEQ